MTSGTTLLAVLSLGILAAVQTDGPAPRERSKPAWQWTAEERIAMRTDPVAARDRVARERAANDRRRVASNAPDPNAAVIVDSFDGRTHPELFLPHEVIRHVISIAFLSSPRTHEAFRGAMQDDLERLELPADFWQRFEAIFIVHVGDERRYIEVARTPQAAREDLALARREACRSAAAALAAARREFGEERFDRFLYEGVATGMFHVTDQLPDPKRMREQAGGCP